LLTREELKLLPGGFDRVGHVVILSLPPQLKHKSARIGQALLRLRGVRTVAVKSEVVGRYRKPRLKIIAGERATETLHREHDCTFKLDVAQVMFSAGNLYERGRIAKLVRPGETVVDLFAGVGQFSVPIARHARPHKVYAVEINPVAHRYLCENVGLNRVGHVMKPLLGDCEEVAPRGVADRVIMGILHVTHKYLPLAIQVLKSKGGIIHYHESVPSKLRFKRPVERVLAAAGGREVEILNKRLVKRYAPGVDHVVIDAKIS
jgi:tRNA wybutosine-synthesizing protein 2